MIGADSHDVSIFRKELTVVSQTVGASKPNTKMWEILFECVKKADSSITKEQIIFIDDKKDNVNSCTSYGMHAVCFNAAKETPQYLWNALEKFGIKIE